MARTRERFKGRLSGRLIGLTLGISLMLGVASGITTQPAIALLDYDYTVEIPATLTVSNPGWNPTDGITAKGSLGDFEKLVVMAESENGSALVSDQDSIGYRLATQDGGEETTTWEFNSLSETPVTQPMGIIVDDFSSKPAGDYTDTVWFSVSVDSTRNVLHVHDDNGGLVQLYYADGETYGAAITNHSEANFGWRTESNTVCYGSSTLVFSYGGRINKDDPIDAVSIHILEESPHLQQY